MGFGKFLLGGVCAVGAVVAAPVVLPAAGISLIGSAGIGVAGTVASTAGWGLLTASSTTLAVGAGAAAAATGTAIGNVLEKEGRREGRKEGEKEGYVKASNAYETKFRQLEEEFERLKEECGEVIKNLESKVETKNKLFEEMINYIDDLQAQIEEFQMDEMKYSRQIAKLEEHKCNILEMSDSLRNELQLLS